MYHGAGADGGGGVHHDGCVHDDAYCCLFLLTII